MALLFWDGFDSYNSTSDAEAARPIISAWAYTHSGFAYGPFLYTYNGRYGGGGWSAADAGTGYIDISQYQLSEFYMGKAVNLSRTTSFYHIYEQTDNGGSYPTPAITVEYVGSGILRVWRGKGINGYGSDVNKVLLGETPVNTFSLNDWHWVELRVKLSSSSTTNDGIVEFWLDNKLVVSNTACVTKNYSSTYYRGTGLCVENGDGNALHNVTDDIYILDTTGPSPWNTRLGDCRIATIKVNADAGPNQGIVASGNSNHYVAVTDVPYDSADYITIAASASGSGELFKHAALPSTNTFSILASAVVAVARKTDAGNSSFKLSVKTGSNTYNSNTQYLTTSNAFFRQEWVTNPNTSSQWTVSDWTTANLGFYVV